MKIAPFLSALVLMGAAGSANALGFANVGLGQTFWDEAFENTTGYSLSGGIEIVDFFGAELGYVNFGKTEAEKDLSVFTNDQGFVGITPSAEADGWTFGGVALVPFTEQLSLVARLGLLRWDMEFSYDVHSTVYTMDSDSDSGTDPYYGVGLNFYVQKNIGLGVQYTRYEIDDSDIGILGGNFQFRF